MKPCTTENPEQRAYDEGLARRRNRRPSVCPGSGRRVAAPCSTAFPEEKCGTCDAYLIPVLDDKWMGTYRVRSHRPLGAWPPAPAA